MLKIAIVEDNAQYRKALSLILQLNDQLNIVHILENCSGMINCFENDMPDIVLMDIDMPGINGIQGVWEIKKYFPHIKILILTVFEDEQKIFGALKAGANGYMLKKDSPQKILDAIYAVSNGESPMNGIIATKVLEYFQQEKNRILNHSTLTERENQILQLLIRGNSYKETAAGIFISTETLNSHIKNIYRKLKVHSRSELAAKYGSVK